jgi:hypothetical protein
MSSTYRLKIKLKFIVISTLRLLYVGLKLKDFKPL